jgi:hypothetical protein
LFEKIVLRRSEVGSALTVGEIAEAILFYQNVHLVLDYGSLIGLIKKIGMPTLLSLLSRPNVSAVYCEETLGTRTDTVGPLQIHEFVAFMFAGDQTVGQLKGIKKRLEHIVERQGYKKKQAQKLVERFRRHVPIKKLSGDYFVTGGIVNSALADINDQDFIHEAMRRVLSRQIDSELVSKDFIFQVSPLGKQFQIITNIDFDLINSKGKQNAIEDSNITPAHFINNVLEARSDTVLASHYGGDFHTSEISSSIIRLKHQELLRRIGIDKIELREFQDIVLDQAPSLREVLNSGERTFPEFLKLLDKSQKFREWTRGVNPDEKLVKAYFQDVTSEGWISTLPSKVIRYVLGSVATAVAPVAGAIGSFADTLVTEKILGGWRPSHFIEKKLKPFLQED